MRSREPRYGAFAGVSKTAMSSREDPAGLLRAFRDFVDRQLILHAFFGEDGEIQAPGAIGEVVVSGPNVMLGYVSQDERKNGVIDEQGRLRTGDLARMDAEGYAYLVGRKSGLIKTVGERVFHQKFGYGRVTSIDRNKLAITFDKAGDKKVLDSFVIAADTV